MIKFVHRVSYVAAVCVVALILGAGAAVAATPPWYAEKSRTTSAVGNYGRCWNVVTGRSATSSTYGRMFISNTFADGSVSCYEAYVEVVYIDRSGIERYIKKYATVGGISDQPARPTIILHQNQYSRILEVVGTSWPRGRGETPTVYLFF